MLKSGLWDYCDTQILAIGTITINEAEQAGDLALRQAAGEVDKRKR